jgi:hypothetical protein
MTAAPLSDGSRLKVKVPSFIGCIFTSCSLAFNVFDHAIFKGGGSLSLVRPQYHTTTGIVAPRITALKNIDIADNECYFSDNLRAFRKLASIPEIPQVHSLVHVDSGNRQSLLGPSKLRCVAGTRRAPTTSHRLLSRNEEHDRESKRWGIGSSECEEPEALKVNTSTGEIEPFGGIDMPQDSAPNALVKEATELDRQLRTQWANMKMAIRSMKKSSIHFGRLCSEMKARELHRFVRKSGSRKFVSFAEYIQDLTGGKISKTFQSICTNSLKGHVP